MSFSWHSLSFQVLNVKAVESWPEGWMASEIYTRMFSNSLCMRKAEGEAT